MEENKQMITINGKEFDLNSLPEEVKKQLNNIKLAERELRVLQAKQTIAQTALNSFKKSLIAALPKD